MLISTTPQDADDAEKMVSNNIKGSFLFLKFLSIFNLLFFPFLKADLIKTKIFVGLYTMLCTLDEFKVSWKLK